MTKSQFGRKYAFIGPQVGFSNGCYMCYKFNKNTCNKRPGFLAILSLRCEKFVIWSFLLSLPRRRWVSARISSWSRGPDRYKLANWYFRDGEISLLFREEPRWNYIFLPRRKFCTMLFCLATMLVCFSIISNSIRIMRCFVVSHQ